MSKHIIFVVLLLIIFFILPPVARAASISPIEDITPDETKKVTISGLDANQKYFWMERKQTIAIYLPGQDPFTTIFTDCFDSDNTGKIVQDLGPYHTPGFYKLIISKANDRDGCSPTLNQIESQDFSVGGPIKPDQSCCNTLIPVYDKDKDICKKDVWNPPWDPGITEPTNCKGDTPEAYCEPESLKCFSSQTFVIRGKICKNPKDPDFDKSRHIECTNSEGQITPGCTDNLNDPGIATAIGCIHTNPAEFVKDLMKFVVGISGGLAFLMMLLGAFQMLTSAGNPETLSAGRDRLTSAVIGLLFVIFAILLLQIIGVDILKIPGFGR